MSVYSEKELLMLSNFVYVPACISTGTISEILDEYRLDDGSFSEESVSAAGIGGGMSGNEIVTLFNSLDEEIAENPSFGELSASRILEERDVRAVCYTNAKDEEPVVAFRGTGGTKEAWSDNFEGEFESETRIQKIAGDFVRYECASYDNITVTGHSKGGNMAQFVTVTCPDRIEKCVSYDGQGFGEDFLKKYRTQIETAAPKIKSICAYNDFVNILLTCVAGEVVYVNNKEGAAYAHSSISLLTENEYDGKGDFVSVRSHGIVSKGLENVSKGLEFILKPFSEEDKEIMADVMGSAVTQAFTISGESAPQMAVGLAVGTVADFFYKRMDESQKVSLGNGNICVEETGIDWNGLSRYAQMIKGLNLRVGKIRSRIEEMSEDINYTIAAKIYAERILRRAIESMDESMGECDAFSSMLTEIGDRYKERETAVASLFAV